ncbi:hypothetical protein CFP56_037172 [Quercus suber]|uniref:DM2 domain-containing protein n=1 Tax=Quercus suber TaxID=58331 RepID=A0AAW0LQF2_QUESU
MKVTLHSPLSLTLSRLLSLTLSQSHSSVSLTSASLSRTPHRSLPLSLAHSHSRSVSLTTTKARSNIGSQKVVQFSPQLGKFLDGATESSRTHAIKKVWEHIKLHHIQLPEQVIPISSILILYPLVRNGFFKSKLFPNCMSGTMMTPHDDARSATA